MNKCKTKDFFGDLRTGMSPQELMLKYALSKARLNRIFGKLGQSDLIALRELWEREKLNDSQFMRAFQDLENELCGDDG